MKRLTLLAIPFFASPVLAADLDGPRYTEREVIYERRPTVLVESHHYRAPVEYDDHGTDVYVRRPRAFRHPHPEYYGWFGHRYHHHRHWGHHRHHHHR